MFIVWSGLGFLIIPVVIVGALVGGAIAEFEPNARWPRMIALLGTALAVYGLGALLNRKQVLGHDQFGNAVTSSGGHSLLVFKK